MDVDPDGATWRKSSYSNGTGGECVEVADLPSGRAVRDSKHPEGPILVFTREGWQAFVQGIQAGELGVPGQQRRKLADGSFSLRGVYEELSRILVKASSGKRGPVPPGR
jgi:hypothetical protein